MTDNKLSERQAYLAMYAFLEHWYDLTKSDEIGILLGGLALLPDGSAADLALESDWTKAVQRVLRNEVDARLSLR